MFTCNVVLLSFITASAAATADPDVIRDERRDEASAELETGAEDERSLLPSALGGTAVGVSAAAGLVAGAAAAALIFGIVGVGTTPGVGVVPIWIGNYLPVVAALVAPLPIVGALAAGGSTGAWVGAFVRPDHDEDALDNVFDGALYGALAPAAGIAAGSLVGIAAGGAASSLGVLMVLANPQSVAEFNAASIANVALVLGAWVAVPVGLVAMTAGAAVGGLFFAHHLHATAPTRDISDEGGDV